MKKIFISILLMTISFAFSQTLPKKLLKQLEELGLFYFEYRQRANANPDIQNYDPSKLCLRISCISEQEYLKWQRSYLDPRLFSDAEKGTVEDSYDSYYFQKVTYAH